MQSNGLLYSGIWEHGEPVSRELLFQTFQSSPGNVDQYSNKLLTRGFQDNEEWLPKNYPAENEASSVISSSSSSSTPVFSPPADSYSDEEHSDIIESPKRVRRRRSSAPFSKKFERVQQLSSVISLEEWSVHELAYFLSACGLETGLTELITAHRVDGKLVYTLLSSGSEAFRENLFLIYRVHSRNWNRGSLRPTILVARFRGTLQGSPTLPS